MAVITRAARAAAQLKPNDSLLTRIAEGLVTAPALALGFNVANDVEGVHHLLDLSEGFLGPMLTGMLITSMGEMVQIKGDLKQKVIAKGIPGIFVNGFNGLMDEAFEGIWAARAARGAGKKDPITEADVKAGMKLAKEKFAEAKRLERTKFMTALKDVDPAKREEYLRKSATFTDPADVKKLAYYRPLLVNEKWMIEHLADLDTAQWFTALESTLGAYVDHSAKAVVKNALHAFSDGAKAALHQMEDALKAPAAGEPNPTGDALSKMKKRARNRGI